MRAGSLLALASAVVLAGSPAVAAASASSPEPSTENRTSSVITAAREWWGALSDVSVLRPTDVTSIVQQMRSADQADDARSARRDGTTQAPRPRPLPAAGAEGPVADLADLSRPGLIEQRLEPLAGLADDQLRVTVPGGQARLGDFSIGSDQRLEGHLLVVRGNADVYGHLSGNLVTLDGDVIVHPGAVVSGDVLALRGDVRDEGGEIIGEMRELSAPVVTAAARQAAAERPRSALERTLHNVAGVAGVFLACCALGFGLVLFGRHNLEVVSDTVSHSFGRAFVTGLVGQLLLVPTFGMLIVGLILSVVGVLLVPFAVVVYALLAVVGIVGGFLAVTHALGETYIRRRLALGELVASPNSYRYLLVGLSAAFVLWGAWALFGWVPIAGDLIRGAAILVTWLLATAGFGAALLSRAGIRENFAGRLLPPEALTDEYLWATPQFGVPAVKRPGTNPGPRTPARGH